MLKVIIPGSLLFWISPLVFAAGVALVVWSDFGTETRPTIYGPGNVLLTGSRRLRFTVHVLGAIASGVVIAVLIILTPVVLRHLGFNISSPVLTAPKQPNAPIVVSKSNEEKKADDHKIAPNQPRAATVRREIALKGLRDTLRDLREFLYEAEGEPSMRSNDSTQRSTATNVYVERFRNGFNRKLQNNIADLSGEGIPVSSISDQLAEVGGIDAIWSLWFDLDSIATPAPRQRQRLKDELQSLSYDLMAWETPGILPPGFATIEGWRDSFFRKFRGRLKYVGLALRRIGIKDMKLDGDTQPARLMNPGDVELIIRNLEYRASAL